jgi:hypothetical protein
MNNGWADPPRGRQVRVDLFYEAGDAPLGAVIGGVDILDERLSRIGGAVVRAGVPVPAVLPSTGQFFASGRLASGVRVSGALSVTAGSTPRRWRLEPQDGPGSVPDPPALPVQGWLTGWHRHAGEWRSDAPLTVHRSPAHADVVPEAPDGSGEPVVVQVALDDGAPLMCVVPAGAAVRVAYSAGTGTARLGPPPGVAHTLLHQVQGGDLTGADVTIGYLLSAGHAELTTGDPLLDLLIGYRLLHAGEPRQRSGWAGALARRQPGSVDACVILACAETLDDPSRELDVPYLAALLDTGLPAFRDGLRLLVELFELAGGYDRPGAAAEGLRTAHRYLQCARPTMLTTFYGETPDEPATRPRHRARPPRGAVPLVAQQPARERSTLVRAAVARFLVPVRAHVSLSDPTPAPPRGGDLRLPDQLREVVGAAAVGSVTLRRGTAHVVIDHVDAALLGGRRIVAIVAGAPVPLVPRGTMLTGSAPTPAALPGSLEIEVHPADEA